MTDIIIQGIGDGLTPEQSHALDILSSLPLAHFNRLKQIMQSDVPNVLGPTTLEKFLDLCQTLHLDLTDAGVNAFKTAHSLGNSGALQTVIGPQTAETYFNEIIHDLNALPANNSNQAMNSQTMNQEGLDLVKEFEGLARRIPGDPNHVKAYLDSVDVPTIGYGHTHGVHLGDVISKQQAEDFLRADLANSEQAVRTLVTVPLTSNQFSALVSFVFNLGAGALKRSTLLKLVNTNKFADAANEFSKFVMAGGHPLAGLVRRRAAEKALFLKP